MSMTNAERQARFRFRRKAQGHFVAAKGTPMERLDAWVSSDAAHGLRVLAVLNGSTAQEELNRLILAGVGVAKQESGSAWSAASMSVLVGPVTG